LVKTREEYLESLRDGRQVYFDGKLVEDVTKFKPLKWGLETYARIYDAKKAFPKETTFKNDQGKTWDLTLKMPTSYADIVVARELHEFYFSYLGEGLSRIPPLTLQYIITPMMFKSKFDEMNKQYGQNIDDLYRLVGDKDELICAAFSDPRGDRSISIIDQEDPDVTLRIVERNDKGVVVRGAKIIASASPFSHELFVTSYFGYPTDKFSPYALLFMIPVNSPGLKLVCRPSLTAEGKDSEWTLRQDEMDAFVIFDNVFIPNERIFFAGEWQFGNWFQQQYQSWWSWGYAVQGMLRAELMLGCAKLVTEYTGTGKFPAVKDKLAEMAAFIEGVRSFVRTSEMEYEVVSDGIVRPNTATSVAGQWFTNQNFQSVVNTLRDLAGAFVVTVPEKKSLDDSPELKGFFTKYFGYRKDIASADERMALYRLIRDLTYNSIGGRIQYLQMYYNGTNSLQKTLTYEYYDGFDRAVARAKRASGIDPNAKPWLMPKFKEGVHKRADKPPDKKPAGETKKSARSKSKGK
jgi:aromatic ring hydroxylase